MDNKKSFNLSTLELIVGLHQAGYKEKARLLKKECNLKKKEIKEAVNKVNQASKESSKAILHLFQHLSEAQRNVRFDNGQELLIIHSIDSQQALIERIRNNRHTFTYQTFKNDFAPILCDFYGFDINIVEDPAKINLDIDTNTFDMIHSIEKEELDQMIRDETQPSQIRLFLKSFKANGQSTNQISYMSSKTNHMEDVHLFIPGKEYIWSIDHKNVNDDQIIATSCTFRDFFQAVQQSVIEYLSSVATIRKQKDVKLFSFKRGFSFYLRANAFLLFILLLFYVNKNSWGLEGGGYVLFFAVQVEALLIILSLVACLQPKTT